MSLGSSLDVGMRLVTCQNYILSVYSTKCRTVLMTTQLVIIVTQLIVVCRFWTDVFPRDLRQKERLLKQLTGEQQSSIQHKHALQCT